jgi:hypothetical protein
MAGCHSITNAFKKFGYVAQGFERNNDPVPHI